MPIPPAAHYNRIYSIKNNILNITGTHLALSLKGYGIVEGVAPGCGGHVEAGGGGQHARVQRGEGRARLAGVAPAAAPHGAVRALVPQVLGELLVEPANITVNTVLQVTYSFSTRAGNEPSRSFTFKEKASLLFSEVKFTYHTTSRTPSDTVFK